MPDFKVTSTLLRGRASNTEVPPRRAGHTEQGPVSIEITVRGRLCRATVAYRHPWPRCTARSAAHHRGFASNWSLLCFLLVKQRLHPATHQFLGQVWCGPFTRLSSAQ